MTHYHGILQGTIEEIVRWLNKIEYQYNATVRVTLPVDIVFADDRPIENYALPSPHGGLKKAILALPFKLIARNIFKVFAGEVYDDKRQGVTLRPTLTIIAKRPDKKGE